MERSTFCCARYCVAPATVCSCLPLHPSQISQCPRSCRLRFRIARTLQFTSARDRSLSVSSFCQLSLRGTRTGSAGAAPPPPWYSRPGGRLAHAPRMPAAGLLLSYVALETSSSAAQVCLWFWAFGLRLSLSHRCGFTDGPVQPLKNCDSVCNVTCLVSCMSHPCASCPLVAGFLAQAVRGPGFFRTATASALCDLAATPSVFVSPALFGPCLQAFSPFLTSPPIHPSLLHT